MGHFHLYFIIKFGKIKNNYQNEIFLFNGFNTEV